MTTCLPVFVSEVQQSIRSRRKLEPGVNRGLNMLIFRSLGEFPCEAAPLETAVKDKSQAKSVAATKWRTTEIEIQQHHSRGDSFTH